MEDSPPRTFDAPVLREAMARRLHRRAEAEGKITVPAVPSMVDEYVEMCETILAGMGIQYTVEQAAQLKKVLQSELTKAYKTSSRSVVVIEFNAPWGTTLNYRVKADWLTIEEDYERWVAVRPSPLFGSEPDARVCALADEAADPRSHRVLDIGAGTGRNALALARRGHPVDAVEMTAKFADTMRSEAEAEALDVHVIQADVFTATDGVESEYQLIVVSEVVPDFRAPSQLRGLFELCAQLLVSGGRLVLNTFLPRPGYTPDDAAREIGQQFNSMIFTRQELTDAAARLPLELIADDSAYEYEKRHLPAGAWPPTGWFDGWATGLDIFDVAREESPIELRWLVYQKTG